MFAGVLAGFSVGVLVPTNGAFELYLSFAVAVASLVTYRSDV